MRTKIKDLTPISPVTPFGDSIRVTCKVIATDTAKVLGATRSDIAKTKAIEELLARGIETRGAITGEAVASTKSSTPRTIDIHDFIFEAKECRRSGQRTLCIVAVMNNAQQTRNFSIMKRDPGESILVDDNGTQYNPEGIVFGGKGSLEGGWSLVNDDIPTALPFNITVSYRGVNPDAKSVSVVLDCQRPFTGPFKAVLRNIPLVR